MPRVLRDLVNAVQAKSARSQWRIKRRRRLPRSRSLLLVRSANSVQPHLGGLIGDMCCRVAAASYVQARTQRGARHESRPAGKMKTNAANRSSASAHGSFNILGGAVHVVAGVGDCQEWGCNGWECLSHTFSIGVKRKVEQICLRNIFTAFQSLRLGVTICLKLLRVVGVRVDVCR